MYAMSMWTYHGNSGTFLWKNLQGISINYFDKNSGKRHACLPHTRPLSKWVKCEPHDVDALNDLVRWTHGGLKTVTAFFRSPFIIPVHHYQIGQQLWWEQDIASIPREFFAILLSHDDFFYQEALTMMQSEAVMHVPMPDYSSPVYLSMYSSTMSKVGPGCMLS